MEDCSTFKSCKVTLIKKNKLLESANWIFKVLAKISSFSLLKIHQIWNILFYFSDTKYITLSKTSQVFSVHIFKAMNSHTQSLVFKWRCTHLHNLIYIFFIRQSYKIFQNQASFFLCHFCSVYWTN